MEYIFSEEQIKQLEPLEKHFRTVIKAQWKRGTTIKENNLAADLYEEVTGGKLNRNWSCGKCCFNVYKIVGELYFASKEAWEKGKVVLGFEPSADNQEDTKTRSHIRRKKRVIRKKKE